MNTFFVAVEERGFQGIKRILGSVAFNSLASTIVAVTVIITATIIECYIGSTHSVGCYDSTLLSAPTPLNECRSYPSIETSSNNVEKSKNFETDNSDRRHSHETGSHVSKPAQSRKHRRRRRRSFDFIIELYNMANVFERGRRRLHV
uniref:Na_Ca_ex domain-containing protein n=1 Tax=Syphacia muris TaxID=451379 RepID=A0A0N5AU53_9BILA